MYLNHGHFRVLTMGSTLLYQCPDLVNEWVQAAFAERHDMLRRVHLGRSFYEALCIMLLQNSPDKGVALYWQLQEMGTTVNLQDRHSKIRLLDQALFKVPPTEEIKNAWKRKLEQCCTDRELMEFAVLAQYGNGQNWLWSYVETGVWSSVPIDKSRSITILAFIDREEAVELLNILLKEEPDTWVKRLVETSLQRWQLNAWAKYWFDRFLNDDNDITAWASFRLFLQCVDSRFWHWQPSIKAKVASNGTMEKRWMFYLDNLDTLRNRIRKNEDSLEKHFLGQKTLQNQVWPWM